MKINDEIKSLFRKVRITLGEPMVDVELTDEYLEWYSSEDKRIEDMPRTYGVEMPETILNDAGDNYLGSILENKGANVLKLNNTNTNIKLIRIILNILLIINFYTSFHYLV